MPKLAWLLEAIYAAFFSRDHNQIPPLDPNGPAIHFHVLPNDKSWNFRVFMSMPVRTEVKYGSPPGDLMTAAAEWAEENREAILEYYVAWHNNENPAKLRGLR